MKKSEVVQGIIQEVTPMKEFLSYLNLNVNVYLPLYTYPYFKELLAAATGDESEPEASSFKPGCKYAQSECKH